ISHPDYHESHYIIEGGGLLVTGGRLLERAGQITTIEGGTSRRVKKGDLVVIPKNTPHWYSEIDGNLLYLENRFKAPTGQ
ncbi:MAG TPA: cupin domain-containing protein, partial [Vicinamibacterales bacterium]